MPTSVTNAVAGNALKPRGPATSGATRFLFAALALAGALTTTGLAQKALTWQEIRDRFETANPTLRAAQLNVDESRAQEITAYLRPNPNFTSSLDQLNPFHTYQSPVSGNDVYRPLAAALPSISANYLHERHHKRELRLESAQKGTAIARSQLADQERTLLFTLRSAFVQTLQASAVLALAKENLAYYSNLLNVSSERLKAGDIARVDFDRLELQRVQYETDVQTATVNLRTAKIQ